MRVMLGELIADVDRELGELRGRADAADRIGFLQDHRRHLAEARAQFAVDQAIPATE